MPLKLNIINMKNTIFICVLLIFATISCSKSSTEELNDNITNAKLLGKWEWIESKGGLSGNSIITPNSTNKTVYLEITNDKIKRFENGILISNIFYVLESKRSIFSGTFVQTIVYDQSTQMKQSFDITNNSLILNDECYDCFVHTFVKK